MKKIASTARAAAKVMLKAAEAVQRFEDGMMKAGETFVRNDIEYVVNKAGVAVRQPSKDKPVTREEVVYLLTGVRVVDVEEVLHAVGQNVFRFMKEQGYLMQDATNPSLFWVTKKAAANYDLPKPVVGGVACQFA